MKTADATGPIESGSYERERVEAIGVGRAQFADRVQLISELPSPICQLRQPPLAHARSYGRVLVLGLGNDILTDDAVGLLVAREVRKRIGDAPGIAVRETMEMGLTLLDEIVDCENLLIVDAVQTGHEAPGHVHEIGPDDLPQVTATSPHFVGVGETLALGTTLGLAMPRRVRIFAIEVADPFTLGTQLTAAVAQAVPVAAERVVNLARAWV